MFGAGTPNTITSNIKVNDGNYHIVKFLRNGTHGSLIVDSEVNPSISTGES